MKQLLDFLAIRLVVNKERQHILKAVLANAVLLDGRFGVILASKCVVNIRGIKMPLAKDFAVPKENLRQQRVAKHFAVQPVKNYFYMIIGPRQNVALQQNK
jgi:hypothetical protein